MTGNSSNFTEANRRVGQPRSDSLGRGADRAMMIEALSGVLITELAGGNEHMAHTRRPQTINIR
jgi:hypothetical protein